MEISGTGAENHEESEISIEIVQKFKKNEMFDISNFCPPPIGYYLHRFLFDPAESCIPGDSEFWLRRRLRAASNNIENELEHGHKRQRQHEQD